MSVKRWAGVALIVVGLLTAGCAATTATRSGDLGVLSPSEPLVRLVVTADLSVVRSECPIVFTGSALLGCQTSRLVALANGGKARTVKIVRYSDSMPSQLAFDIDIHELCHAVAALQQIDDPCHIGNGGVVEMMPAALPRGLFLR